MSQQESTRQQPITDSPWFWLALFTAVGFSALMATGGKFGKRQSGIERKYQAREWVQGKSGKPRAESGGLANDIAEESSKESSTKTPDYSTPEKTLIPMWPLAVILAMLCAGSIAMLLRERLHTHQPDCNAVHGNHRNDASGQDTQP